MEVSRSHRPIGWLSGRQGLIIGLGLGVVLTAGGMTLLSRPGVRPTAAPSPLQTVAEISFGNGLSQIDRYNRARQISIEANLQKETLSHEYQQASNVTPLLRDRVVLITGASRGIGAATAKLLGEHGAAVGVNYYDSEAAAQEVVESITSKGGKAVAAKADVRDRQQVEGLVQQVSATLGAIDTLVINANANFPITPFVDYRWEDFEAKLLGELKGAFFPCQAIVPAMIEHHRGCIIAVSSSLSRDPGPGFVAHSTAKSGLDAFIKSLALELGPHGIRANVVAPGLTLTDATARLPQDHKDASAQMVPLKRNGLPEDIAGAILLLASDEAKFISGAYLPVSGGVQML